MYRSEDRTAVAAFIRDRRERTRPEDVGLPPGPRRRTPGLRREEVAQIAGVGVTWYTWFEQGRDIGVSAAFLERLCQAFRLTPLERAHLFTLAHDRPPPTRQTASDGIPEAARAVVMALPTPAYLKTARWDVVAWNAAAQDLFPDFEKRDADERNLIWLIFQSPAFRELMLDWETDARRSLSKFRVDHARAKGDPGFQSLVDDLLAHAPDFRDWWASQDVLGIGHGVKFIRHPTLGPIEYDHVAFTVEGCPDLRLIIYIPKGP
ncbi:MAG: helix-turn-helix transcriptional regulator [Rhodospirillum sp.]|nr:helix-turn-helix transcriptional regulator [Rhodospirillum sp.]MCF8491465.1 helix-turn-helix transcriptional regulator [Rhodospirillum sp.]MCF8498873.1 helix-turn-helix transcriptional regulator [Rhodospirillum sp.]